MNSLKLNMDAQSFWLQILSRRSLVFTVQLRYVDGNFDGNVDCDVDGEVDGDVDSDVDGNVDSDVDGNVDNTNTSNDPA